MYLASGFLVVSLLALLFMSPAIRVSTSTQSMSQLVESQTVVRIEPFNSIELRRGGKAIVQHGPIQRVTLFKGNLDYTHVAIASGNRLVIDKCRTECPRGYELEIEIVTPDIAGISVADGGTIEVRGSFPRRAEIGVAVHDGGTIDIRSLTVDSVTASVNSGGRIFTRPQSAMIASVRQGGLITYWGDVQVTSSIRHGGVVTKGDASEADKPISEFDQLFTSVPPVPPLPKPR